jgi:hypothetical protein
VLLKTGLDLQQKNTRSYKYKRQVFKSAYKWYTWFGKSRCR